jgi:uncharacterized protein with HEPN domain
VKDDRLYLIHMSECVARIEEYVRGGREAFMASTLVQDAVVRNLQTLAESGQRLSPGFKEKHPEVDWRGIAAFRNILVHDYLGLDVERVWEVIQHDLPELKSKIAAFLRESKPGP